jgi:hypothetical protein
VAIFPAKSGRLGFLSLGSYLVPKQLQIPQGKKMNENSGEEFAAIIDELLNILHQPVLPPDHPDAPAQKLEKREAQAALDDIRTRLLPPVTRLALARLHELIALPLLPHDDPNSADLAEVKRKARITLLKWNAHYGPGGPYEALSPTREDDGG